MRLKDALCTMVGTARRRQIGPAEAEHLVADPAARSEHPGVSYLLAAAAAPPHPGEYVGREAMLAEFDRAGRNPDPTPPPLRSGGGRRPLLLSRSVAMKAVVAGTAVLLMGGTAVAAQTGSLPAGAQRQAHDLFSGWGVPPPDTNPTVADRPPGQPAPTATESNAPTTRPPVPRAEPQSTPPPTARGSDPPAGTVTARVAAVRDTVQDQARAGHLDPDAAGDLTRQLDEIDDQVAIGNTSKTADKVADLRDRLADLRDAGKITADGYQTVLASLDALAGVLPQAEQDDDD